jgi:hypothetical protein
MIGHRGASTWALRAFAGLIPIAVWLPYLITIAITDGLGWNATMTTGVLSTTAGVGYAVALLTYPPVVLQED